MANVTVYSTPTCPYCTMVKNYLSEKNVPFTDYDVSADRNALTQMRSKSGQMGVPVVDIDGTIIIGFNQAEIDKALNL